MYPQPKNLRVYRFFEILWYLLANLTGSIDKFGASLSFLLSLGRKGAQ